MGPRKRKVPTVLLMRSCCTSSGSPPITKLRWTLCCTTKAVKLQLFSIVVAHVIPIRLMLICHSGRSVVGAYVCTLKPGDDPESLG